MAQTTRASSTTEPAGGAALDRLRPRLRFPEFCSDGHWVSKPLSELTDRIDERVGDLRLTPVSISAGRGFVSQAEKFGRDISGAQYKNYIRLKRGDFAYNKGNSNLYPQGCVYRLKEFDEAAASNAFICFSLKEKNAAGFFEGLFEKNAHGRQLIRFLTSGARSDGLLNIKPEEFFSVRFPIPPRSAEQQKIADCLRWLDEVIAAQVRKVEALKAHKKGLMQHLFPREGEPLPRLRFPEFRDGPEWEPRRVDQCGNVQAGKALAVNAPGALRPYLRTKNVLDGAIDLSDVLSMPMTDAEFSRFEILKGDILLNEGQALDLVGRTAMYRGEFGARCAIQNQLLRFRAFPSICAEFAAQAFRLYQKDGTFAAIATKTTSVAHLGGSRLSALMVTWPPSLAEQQRVADCFASLDAAIASAAAALAALKTHRKGLMQGLFPLAEAVGTPSANPESTRSGSALVLKRPTAATDEGLLAPSPARKRYQVGFARLLLAAEILQHCHTHPTMGRVKLQKLIHLCEYHAELDDIHGNYARAAAGPFDNKLMRGVALGLEKQKWFKQVRGEKGTTYQPMELAGRHAKYLSPWSTQLPKVYEVLRLFAEARTSTCEIASTLYAAWNDLLLDGQTPTDDDIIREASDPKRWHESKGKIDKTKWPAALKWMREKGLVPRGYGSHTKRPG